MADSQVTISAGTGTNIDTRTESTNGQHRQVIVIGDPSTNAGVAPVDVTKGLAVDLTNTGANSTAIKVDPSSVTSPVSLATNTPVGTVAHAVADSGNPVKIGAKAITSLKTTTLVSSANRTDVQSDLDGAIIIRSQFPLGDLLSERISNTDGASTAFTNFSAVASTKNYITAISVYNSSGTAGFVDFRDGTAGSILYTLALPAGGGAIISGGDLPLFKTSANTALAYDVSAGLTTVYISVSGFQSKL